MGNLLGSPVTTKDTHTGTTHDANFDSSTSPDGGGLQFGISSMQGWRVHMEDAHIAQPFVYAEKKYNAMPEEGGVGVSALAGRVNADIGSGGGSGGRTDYNQLDYSSSTINYIRIPLPNHSLFAVFDGHGGSFAAEFASRNFLRVLCRQDAFVEYATKWNGRDSYLDNLRSDLVEKDKEESITGSTATDEGDVNSDTTPVQSTTSDNNSTKEPLSASSNHSFEIAKASYDHGLMTLLENALQDAFCDVDAEILREVSGLKVEDANVQYGRGYDPNSRPTGETNPNKCDKTKDKLHSSSNTKDVHPTPIDDEDAGTTAVVVLLTPRWIVCANAGDSRSIYSRSNHRAVPLSYDHKPDDEEEERRINDAGGYVSGGRVEGDLAVSRGLGDYRFKDCDTVLTASKGERRYVGNKTRKIGTPLDNTSATSSADVNMIKPSSQKVSPLPDIIVQNRDASEDEFIILACDGIWDVLANQACVRMVADIFEEGESDLGLVCEEILDLCLIKGSKDNMTAAVVKFPKQTVFSGGGVAARRERRGVVGNSVGDSMDENRPELYVPPQKRDGEANEMIDKDAQV